MTEQGTIWSCTEAVLEARREAARAEAAAQWEYEHGPWILPLHGIVGIYSVDDRFWERHDVTE